jgi:hypothetical protein
MVVQPAARIAGDEAVKIDTITEWQTKQVVTLQVWLLVGAGDDATAAVGTQPIKQSIRPVHLISLI